MVAHALVAWALLLAQLFIHELGHIAFLHLKGVRIEQYWLGLGPKLFGFGKWKLGMLPIGAAVVPERKQYALLSPRDRVFSALAGPIASLCAAGVFFAVWLDSGSMPGHSFLAYMALMNLVLFALNILPIPPLDGFHAWAAWREAQGSPLPKKTQRLLSKTGNALVYAAGFFLVTKELVTWLAKLH